MIIVVVIVNYTNFEMKCYFRNKSRSTPKFDENLRFKITATSEVCNLDIKELNLEVIKRLFC